MNKIVEVFSTDPCKDFDEFVLKAKGLQQKEGLWIFRGERKGKWCLKTSFERACEKFIVPAEKRVRVEQNMVREFQRRLHHYTANVPRKESNDEWMALMQHYGAPTRLLDFTYSPYVAAYFAFEAADSNCTVGVWAVNTDSCVKQLELKYEDFHKQYKLYEEERQSEHFNSIFMPRPVEKIRKMVLPINPFRLNERLAYQRGVFLCPGDVRIRFMDNLQDFMGKEKLEEKVIKFTIPTGEKGQFRDYALRSLDLMNINRITLFPGLDGFAQSFSPRIPSLFLHQRE